MYQCFLCVSWVTFCREFLDWSPTSFTIHIVMHLYITGATYTDIHENLIYKLGIFSGPNDSLGGQQNYLNGFEINEIYVTALYHRDVKWVSWHLKSPDNRLFVQQIVHANIKAPHHWHSLRGTHIRKADSHEWDTNEKSVSISWCHHSQLLYKK